jgi:AbrB family looped-hinge helix DNA binding protein
VVWYYQIAIRVIPEEDPVRVTSKGQVTIPQTVRRRLGIEPGDEVVFSVRDDEAVMRPARDAGQKLVALIAGSATAPEFSRTDEIMRLTRGDD